MPQQLISMRAHFWFVWMLLQVCFQEEGHNSVRKSLKVKKENMLPLLLGGVAKKEMYSINGRE